MHGGKEASMSCKRAQARAMCGSRWIPPPPPRRWWSLPSLSSRGSKIEASLPRHLSFRSPSLPASCVKLFPLPSAVSCRESPASLAHKQGSLLLTCKAWAWAWSVQKHHLILLSNPLHLAAQRRVHNASFSWKRTP